uniref:EamA domain-containing protein n=1 Tax=Alexandrium monilatum TaxID=311494 RepID=A0A7S4Q7Y3_9DINO
MAQAAPAPSATQPPSPRAPLMAEINPRRHWAVASVVLLVDVALVAATVVLDRTHHIEPPAGGATDASAAIGWLGVVSAIVIFGCYGILIKTPAVVQANVDTMIFTSYYGLATAFVSVLIWAVAGSQDGLTLNGGSFAMGALFGFAWTASQMFAYTGVQILGYAVGPAIWIGITICVSFVWGTLVFGNPVISLPGALLAIALLLVGVCLAAASSRLSDMRQQLAHERELALQLTSVEGIEGVAEAGGNKSAQLQTEGSARGPAGGSVLFGLLNCVGVGIFNGSLMVPMRCFQQGCSSIGIHAYEGNVLAPLAFLPSLALGILAVLPVCFALYFWRTLLAGRLPNFHFSVVALPGFLTGMFWGMGNFNAMFATVYLGQTIGYPLTQCCLILNGLWGILYYKEIRGAQPIGLFICASVVIIAGAALDGMYG